MIVSRLTINPSELLRVKIRGQRQTIIAVECRYVLATLQPSGQKSILVEVLFDPFVGAPSRSYSVDPRKLRSCLYPPEDIERIRSYL